MGERKATILREDVAMFANQKVVVEVEPKPRPRLR